jgi:hypothetical protein
MAVLFMVGEHLEDPSIVDFLLDTSQCTGKPTYIMANERPLLLFDCAYKDIPEWICDNIEKQRVALTFQNAFNSMWVETALLERMRFSVGASGEIPEAEIRHIPLKMRECEDDYDEKIRNLSDRKKGLLKPKHSQRQQQQAQADDMAD